MREPTRNAGKEEGGEGRKMERLTCQLQTLGNSHRRSISLPAHTHTILSSLPFALSSLRYLTDCRKDVVDIRSEKRDQERKLWSRAVCHCGGSSSRDFLARMQSRGASTSPFHGSEERGSSLWLLTRSKEKMHKERQGEGRRVVQSSA